MPSMLPKISRELGWKPAEQFESGLRKTVRWYLDHSSWVENVRTGAYLRMDRAELRGAAREL